MSPSVRQRLLSFHSWTGLVAGLVLVTIAVTGALMVFRPQLDPIVNHELLVVPPGGTRLPLDQLAEHVRAVHPEGKLDFIRYYASPSAAVQFRFANKDTFYVDPYTGVLLGRQDRYRGFFGMLENIHRFRYLPAASVVAGSFAMVMVALISAGLVLWWPVTFRALRAGLTVNRRLTGRPWKLNLHKTVGIYAAAVVLLSALTGLPQAFAWVRTAVYAVGGTPLVTPPPASSPGPAVTSWESLARQIAALVPSAQEVLIHASAQGVVESYVIEQGAPHPNARTYIWLDAASGAVLRFSPYATSGPGNKLYYWMVSLHLGRVGGIGGQLLLCFGALAVPVLAWTGVMSFQQRRSRQPARVRAVDVSLVLPV